MITIKIDRSKDSKLTEFGKAIEAFALKGVKELQGVLDNILPFVIHSVS